MSKKTEIENKINLGLNTLKEVVVSMKDEGMIASDFSHVFSKMDGDLASFLRNANNLYWSEWNQSYNEYYDDGWADSGCNPADYYD